MIGRQLAHYEIIRKLGAGGMGEVYVARDGKLDREVALKVLPSALADDPDRLQRFEREARTLAALNHPNIVTIHAVEEADGIRFMTMELIRGRTLDEVIPQEGMALKQFLEVAEPLADAMSAAHASNVQHRDLKPANVMVDEAGRVKVLDFGLAKVEEAKAGPDGLTQMLTGEFTDEGKIIGTVSYMSPEQAEGRTLDHRSDIFSLGILMYEMITGRRPFAGDTNLSILSSILKDEPDSVSDVRDAVPIPVARLIQRCLAKPPERRYQSATDLRQDLADIRRDLDTGEALSSGLYSGVHTAPKLDAPTPWLKYAGIGGALLAAVALAALGWPFTAPPQPVPTASNAAPLPAAADARPSVAVFYFDNISNDEELEWLRTGLTDMMVTDLSQMQNLRVLATDRLYAMLTEMGRQDDRMASADVIRQIADRAGMNTAIVGSFARAAGQIRINARIQDPLNGEVLSSQSVQGATDDVFDLVDELTDWVESSFEMDAAPAEGAVGVTVIADMGDHDLEEVTTDNVEAYRFYNEGVQLNLDSREEEAIPLLEKAVELDPDFAMAYAKLSVAHGNAGDDGKAREFAAKAFEKSDTLPPRERHYIRGRHFSMDPNTSGDSVDEYAKVVEMYPDHTAARNNLASGLIGLERFDDAIVQLEELRKMGARFAPSYGSLARAYAVKGRYDEAVAVLREYVEAYPDNAQGYFNLAVEMTRAGDFDDALEQLDRSQQINPDWRRDVFRWSVLALAERWDEARAFSTQMAAIDDPRAQIESASMTFNEALYFGRVSEAQALAASAVETFAPGSPEQMRARSAQISLAQSLEDADEVLRLIEEARPYVRAPGAAQNLAINTALGHAMLGDAEGAQRAVEDFEEAVAGVPMNERLRMRVDAQIDGVLAWARRDNATAVRNLGTTVELMPTRDIDGEGLSMRFFLAESLWADGQRAAAAEQFRKIDEATLSRVNEPIMWLRALSYLGDFHAELGEREQASEYYRRFLFYWEDGEIDRDRVERARAFLR